LTQSNEYLLPVRMAVFEVAYTDNVLPVKLIANAYF